MKRFRKVAWKNREAEREKGRGYEQRAASKKRSWENLRTWNDMRLCQCRDAVSCAEEDTEELLLQALLRRPQGSQSDQSNECQLQSFWL